MHWTLLFIVLLFPICSSLQSDLLPFAFPTAEGFGRFAQPGVSTPYQVTSLDDSIPAESGTLRYAIENLSGPCDIHFEVTGIIELTQPLVISRPNIRIDGATAANGDITFRGYGIHVVNTHDVILRNLRLECSVFAHNYYYPNFEDSGTALLIDNSSKVIMDHITALHAVNSAVVIRRSQDVTLQWSLIAESVFSRHYEGENLAGFCLTLDSNTGNITCHHNLLMSHMFHNPHITNCLNDSFVDFSYNTVYNYGSEAGTSSGIVNVNFVNNLYKTGPSTNFSDLQYEIFRSSDTTNMYSSKNFLIYKNSKIQLPCTLGGICRKEPFPNENNVAVDCKDILDRVGASCPYRNGDEARLIAEFKLGMGEILGVITN